MSPTHSYVLYVLRIMFTMRGFHFRYRPSLIDEIYAIIILARMIDLSSHLTDKDKYVHQFTVNVQHCSTDFKQCGPDTLLTSCYVDLYISCH